MAESSKHTFQIMGIVMNITFFIISVYICIYPGWRRNDPQGDVIENIIRSQGLWFQCTHYTTGSWQCDDYDQFFISLPAVIQGSRAFMIFSIIASFTSLVLMFPGGRCTIYYMDHPNVKARLAGMSAVLIGIAAFCCLIASSWYAAEVVSAYWMQNLPNAGLQNSNFAYSDRFIYGSCIYLGWVNFILGFGAAVLLCCAARQSDEEMEYGMQQEMGNGEMGGYIPNREPIGDYPPFHAPTYSHQHIPAMYVPKELKPYYNQEPDFVKSGTDFGHVNPNFAEPEHRERHRSDGNRQRQNPATFGLRQNKYAKPASVQEYV